MLLKNFKIYPARDWWTTILPWYKLLKKSMFTKIYNHCFQIAFLPFQKSRILILTRKRTRAKPLYQGNQRYDKNNYRKLMLAGVKHMKSRILLRECQIEIIIVSIQRSCTWISFSIEFVLDHLRNKTHFCSPESNFGFCQESWLKKATKKNNQERFVSNINLNCE